MDYSIQFGQSDDDSSAGSNSNSNSSSKLSTGAISGIVIGSFCAFLLLVALVAYFLGYFGTSSVAVVGKPSQDCEQGVAMT
jgi:F0F1-type ATP synthase assembly protein I